MSFDYFSKRRMQYILEKLKTIFDTKTETWTGTQAELTQQLSSIKDGTIINITDDQEVSGGSLSALSDTNISTPTNGQALVYDSTSTKWKNQSLSIPQNISQMSDIVIDSSSLANGQILKYNSNDSVWENVDDTGGASAFEDLTDVSISSLQNGQVPKWNSTTSKWENADEAGGTPTWTGTTAEYIAQASQIATGTIVNITDDIDNLPQFKVTNFAVGTTGWTTDTTSQSGTTLYKKQISVNNIYSSPSVDIGASTGHVLPTTDEQTAYDLLQYVTFDSSVPCLYLYAKSEPANAFNINVGGVD